jgi:hypothetical protein
MAGYAAAAHEAGWAVTQLNLRKNAKQLAQPLDTHQVHSTTELMPKSMSGPLRTASTGQHRARRTAGHHLQILKGQSRARERVSSRVLRTQYLGTWQRGL